MIRKTYGGAPKVFDEQTALMYSGDNQDMLVDFMKDFLAHKDATVEKLVGSFEEKNWGDYAIFAHGLKSSSLSLGGKKLSATAKSLEEAGKKFDAEDDEAEKAVAVDFIAAHHDELLRQYDEFAAECERYIETNGHL